MVSIAGDKTWFKYDDIKETFFYIASIGSFQTDLLQ